MAIDSQAGDTKKGWQMTTDSRAGDKKSMQTDSQQMIQIKAGI